MRGGPSLDPEVKTSEEEKSMDAKGELPMIRPVRGERLYSPVTKIWSERSYSFRYSSLARDPFLFFN